jgi:hypothetical protein
VRRAEFVTTARLIEVAWEYFCAFANASVKT